jgi:hypothetical protein
MNNIKIVTTQHAKATCIYKNTKEKLLKRNAAIGLNKIELNSVKTS